MLPIRDSIPSRHTPFMMWILIAINVGVFLFELSLGPHRLEGLFYLFGIVPARFSHPEWAATLGFPVDDYWPFLTSMFLHGGWLHLIGNMWTLWIFGDNVEDRMGPVRFLLFYLLCGLSAGITHWFTNPHSTVPTVGASGAIAGVLGAYFILYPTSRIIVMVPLLFWPFFFELPAVIYLAFWFWSQLFSGTFSLVGPQNVGGIAWWAHIGGFITGILIYRFFLGRKQLRQIYEDEFGFLTGWYKI